MVAARGGHLRCVRTLLEHGADLARARALDGATALHLCVSGRCNPFTDGHEAVAQVLCEAGADVNAQDEFGRSSFFRCAMAAGKLSEARIHNRQDTAIPGWFLTIAPLRVGLRPVCVSQTCERMLDCGAEVDATDACGITLLMHAASDGLPELVRGLIDRGADVKHFNAMGQRAADLAERRARFLTADTVASKEWEKDECWLMLTRKREELFQVEGIMPLINSTKETLADLTAQLAKARERAAWRIEEEARLEERYTKIVADVHEEVLKARVGSVIAALCDCLADHEPLIEAQKVNIAALEQEKRDIQQTIQLIKMKAEMQAAMGT